MRYLRRAMAARGARLAFLLIVAVAMASGSATAAESGTPERSRQLYDRHCGVCHREGQTGTVVLGRRLGAERALLATRTDLTAPYVRQVVRSGLVNMPRLTRVELPDADLEAIASWLARPRD
ncbi:MAG: cytochrome c [Pseudomonadota bacterium]|nr:cytochrome c [Pseudomonadota bacterium]